MNYDRYRVLLIDDQSFVRRVVSTMLRQIGFLEIVEAADGTEGLAQVSRTHPHLIICDIEMKPMDGLSFFRSLREQKGQNTPKIILLTSHGDSETVLAARNLGVDSFLLKPVSADQLRKRVSALFG